MFHGEVRKVRPKAEMTQNVVTYPVEVSTDNADGTLRPYLTANVQFEVNRRENVLTVPNAALRYEPDESRIAPDAREAWASAQNEGDGGRGEGRASAGGRPGRRGRARRAAGPRGPAAGIGANGGTRRDGGPTSRPAADATTRPSPPNRNSAKPPCGSARANSSAPSQLRRASPTAS